MGYIAGNYNPYGYLRNLQQAHQGYKTGVAIYKGAKKVFRKIRDNKYIKPKFKKQQKKAFKRPLHQKSFQTPIGSASNFFYGRRKMPPSYAKVYKSLAKNYYAINSAARYTSPVGLQTAASALVICSNTDIATISAKVSSNNTARWLLRKVSAELLITNMDQGPARVTLYDIIARRDSVSGSTAITFPDVAWETSYADEGGSNTDNKVIGATPFSSDLFTQFFKVKKITHIEMPQGSTHTHRVSYTPNKQLDAERIQYVTQNFANLTCFTMVVQHGYPENDSTTKSQVSVGATALDIVTGTQYQYTWIQDVTTSWAKSNNLPGSFSVGSEIVNIGSGAIGGDASG